MNRNICVLLCILAILLTACSNPKQQEVDRNNHERIEREEPSDLPAADDSKRTGQTGTPMVIDETGEKRALNLGNINVKDCSEYFLESAPTAVYSQISDGHYYYMRSDGKGGYTIYRDKGEKVGKFSIEEYSGVICYFVKHGENFYAVYDEEEESSDIEDESDMVQLIKIDLKKGGYTVLPDMEQINLDEFGGVSDKAMYFHFYRDSYFFDTGKDTSFSDLLEDAPLEYFPGKLMKMDPEGKKTEIPATPNMDKAKPCLTFIDGKIYYGIQKGKTVNLYSYDLESGTENEVLCYKRTNQSSVYGYLGDEVHVSIDNDYIYCQDYIIPRKGGKMIRLFKDAWLPDNHTVSFSSNSKYIYYIDKNYRVRRFDKKTGQTVTLTKMQVMDVKCTEKGVYVQKERLMPEDEGTWDLWDMDTPVSCDVYYMDPDGKGMKKIAD